MKGKIKRGLSGVYFRVKNLEGKWDSICFEDLTEEQQTDIIIEQDGDWLRSLCRQLALTINHLGETFDITKE